MHISSANRNPRINCKENNETLEANAFHISIKLILQHNLLTAQAKTLKQP